MHFTVGVAASEGLPCGERFSIEVRFLLSVFLCRENGKWSVSLCECPACPSLDGGSMWMGECTRDGVLSRGPVQY